MTGSRPSLIACLAVVSVAAALLLPAAAAGHQKATLSGGVLTITGDHPSPAGEPKPNDLVTLDTAGDDLVVGNDVFGPHPAECRSSAEHPQRIILCPRALVSEIRISLGIGGDRVVANVPSGTPITASMGAGNDAFEGSGEVDVVRTGSGSDKAYGGSGRDTLKGGSGSDKLFGQGGADKLFGGGAPDKLFGGGGNDSCNPGPGTGKQSSC